MKGFQEIRSHLAFITLNAFLKYHHPAACHTYSSTELVIACAKVTSLFDTKYSAMQMLRSTLLY